MTKEVKTTMTWKGRKLLCNGVCVAEITQGFGNWRFEDRVGSWVYGTLRAARRAVNRRFGLPLNFGAKP